jgi:hypothetical protein
VSAQVISRVKSGRLKGLLTLPGARLDNMPLQVCLVVVGVPALITQLQSCFVMFPALTFVVMNLRRHPLRSPVTTWTSHAPAIEWSGHLCSSLPFYLARDYPYYCHHPCVVSLRSAAADRHTPMAEPGLGLDRHKFASDLIAYSQHHCHGRPASQQHGTLRDHARLNAWLTTAPGTTE